LLLLLSLLFFTGSMIYNVYYYTISIINIIIIISII